MKRSFLITLQTLALVLSCAAPWSAEARDVQYEN
ncbi:MAG: hypothetical protein RL417_2411, partial [Pseudomonadota bacterium]